MRPGWGLIIVLALSACAPSDETLLTPASYADLPGWQDDRHAEALRIFTDACRVNQTHPDAYKTRNGKPVGDRTNWQRACIAAAQLPAATDQEAQHFFEANFAPYRVSTGREPFGHVTGYYEPLLNGSLKRHDRFLTPVYGLPADLKPDEAYYSRAEIDAGALSGRAPVLLYVDDPVLLFFLHIQGSGKVALDDGRIVSLHYAGRNNEPYRPIGAVLKSRGMDEVSMGNIRDWLYAHPDQAQDVMEQNPCYIFFALGGPEEKAKGALGLPLVPDRSVAVDAARAAYGVPTYLATSSPDPSTHELQPLNRLFISEDTGSALSGPHRIDVFFGSGREAEWAAGHQNTRGLVFWLLPGDSATTTP